MSPLLRSAVLAFLVAGSASTAYGGWGHRLGHHHAGYVPYGYAPAGYSQPGYFQSGGSVAQLFFGDRPVQFDFDGGPFDFGVDLGGTGADGDVGEVVDVRVRSLGTERAFFEEPAVRYRSYRIVRASDIFDSEDEVSELRDDVDSLKDSVEKLGRSVKELRRRMDALDGGGTEDPADDASTGTDVGETVTP